VPVPPITIESATIESGTIEPGTIELDTIEPGTIEPDPFDPGALAERVADAVTAHPAVARLHGGFFGDVATYLPGHRLIGVRIAEPGAPVELGVVLHLDRPIPDVVRSLRQQVSLLCGGAPVDIVVADVIDPSVIDPSVIDPGVIDPGRP
jgi:hypothetical protein